MTTFAFPDRDFQAWNEALRVIPAAPVTEADVMAWIEGPLPAIQIRPLFEMGLTRLLFRTLCICLFLLTLPVNAATQLPISVPLRFNIDKFVELSANLTRHRNYYVDIVFYFKDADQRRVVKKIAGEPDPICKALNDCGVTPSFLITIRAGDDVISREERTPIGYYAHGSNEFYRNILVVPLKPGNYMIMVDVMQSSDELKSTSAAIELSTDPRESDLGD